MRSGMSLILCLVLAGACGGGTSTSPNNVNLAGTYTLRSVNGANLPYAIQAQGVSLQVTGDQFVIADGGTFSETTTYKVVSTGATQVGSSTGTWARAGSTIAFSFADGGSQTGTCDGKNLTIDFGTFGTWRYSK